MAVHLSSYFTNGMSLMEYSNSFEYLPSAAPLGPTAYRRGKRAAQGDRRIPRRSNAGRGLLYGSTPDYSSNFNPKLGVIGSERTNPRIFGKDFNSTYISDLDHTNDRLTRPKTSKFANLFTPSEPQEEASTAKLAGQDIRIMTAAADPIPDQYLPNHDIIRSTRPQSYTHGDMSNLRPDDRGMDAATCAEWYRMSTAPEGRMPVIASESDDSAASTSNRVTFDLGAQFATRSTDEQKANCRAKAREMVNEEAIAARDTRALTMSMLQEDDGTALLTSTITLRNFIDSMLTSDVNIHSNGAIADQSNTTDSSVVDEEE